VYCMHIPYKNLAVVPKQQQAQWFQSGLIGLRRRGDPGLQPWGGAPPFLPSQTVVAYEHAANDQASAESNV